MSMAGFKHHANALALWPAFFANIPFLYNNFSLEHVSTVEAVQLEWAVGATLLGNRANRVFFRRIHAGGGTLLYCA
jgi:hypothetical protein